MSIPNPLTATLDEIIFERRNKAYGAFLLRRLYNRHLATAVLAATALASLLVIVPMLGQLLWPTVVVVPPVAPGVVATPIMIDLPKEPKPVAPVAPPRAVHPPMAKSLPQDTPPRIVADDKIKVETRITPPVPSDTSPGAVAGPDNIPGQFGAKGTDFTSTTTGTDSGSTTTSAVPSTPFIHVEVMPEFAGGQEALRRYMQRNLRYPGTALSNSIAGKVYITFVVNADGSISNVEVLKGLGYGLDEEAVRVVRGMPTWKPGQQNNHAVAVRYTMPITFRYE